MTRLFFRVIYLKEIQDKSLLAETHYIRRIISMTEYSVHKEDELGLEGDGDGVRIVICMTLNRNASH